MIHTKLTLTGEKCIVATLSSQVGKKPTKKVIVVYNKKLEPEYTYT